MRALLVLLLTLHGAIHLLGFVKGFGLAEVAPLQRDIGQRAGLLWLAAAILLMAAAVLLLVVPQLWWIPAVAGVVLSQVLILSAWSDARFGTIPNLILLMLLALTFTDFHSTRSRFLGRASVQFEEVRAARLQDPAPDGDRAQLRVPRGRQA